MKLVMFKDFTQFEESSNIITYKKDTSYIMPDAMARFIHEEERENKVFVVKKEIDFYKLVKTYKPGMNLNQQELFVIRAGGFGDILFTTPFVNYLKLTFDCKINLLCGELYVDFFKQTSPYDNVMSLPAEFKEEYRNAYFLSFEGIIENSKDAETLSAYELFGNAFGYSVERDIELRRPVIKLPELKDSSLILDNMKFNIGLQYSASSYIRSWKPEYIFEFLKNWELPANIYIFDSPKMSDDIELILSTLKLHSNVNVINVAKTKLSMLESAQIISQLDLMITPDSALAHIAGGLKIPIIGLFGAFPSKLRIEGYKNSIGMDAYPQCEFARGEFSSCFKHGVSCDLAIKVNRTYSPCMDLITPGDVKIEASKFLKNNYLQKYTLGLLP